MITLAMALTLMPDQTQRNTANGIQPAGIVVVAMPRPAVAMIVFVTVAGSTFTVNAFPHTTIGDVLDITRSAIGIAAQSAAACNLYAYHKTALLHVQQRVCDIFHDYTLETPKMAPPTLFVFNTIVQTAFDACFFMFNMFKAFPRDASQEIAVSVIHPLVPSMHASFRFSGSGGATFCIFDNMTFPVDKSADGAFSFLCERGYFDGLTCRFGPQATQFVVKVSPGPDADELKAVIERALLFGMRYPHERVFLE